MVIADGGYECEYEIVAEGTLHNFIAPSDSIIKLAENELIYKH